MAPKTISRRPLFSGNPSVASHVPGTGVQNYHFRRHLQQGGVQRTHRRLNLSKRGGRHPAPSFFVCPPFTTSPASTKDLFIKILNRRQTKPNHSFKDCGRRYAQARAEVPRSTLRRTCARVRRHTPIRPLTFSNLQLHFPDMLQHIVQFPAYIFLNSNLPGKNQCHHSFYRLRHQDVLIPCRKKLFF